MLVMTGSEKLLELIDNLEEESTNKIELMEVRLKKLSKLSGLARRGLEDQASELDELRSQQGSLDGSSVNDSVGGEGGAGGGVDYMGIASRLTPEEISAFHAEMQVSVKCVMCSVVVCSCSIVV